MGRDWKSKQWKHPNQQQTKAIIINAWQRINTIGYVWRDGKANEKNWGTIRRVYWLVWLRFLVEVSGKCSKVIFWPLQMGKKTVILKYLTGNWLYSLEFYHNQPKSVPFWPDFMNFSRGDQDDYDVWCWDYFEPHCGRIVILEIDRRWDDR